MMIIISLINEFLDDQVINSEVVQFFHRLIDIETQI